MRHTITAESTDPSKYYKIDLSSPIVYANQQVQFCVTTFTTNCNILVLTTDDYLKIEIEDDGYKSDLVFLALDSSLLNLDSFKTFFINDDNYQSPISLLYKIFPLMETFAEKYNRKESNEVLTKLSDEIIYLVNTYIDREEDIKIINILNYQTTTQNYDFIINMHHVDADYYSEFSNETVMFIIPKNKHDHKFDAFVNPSES